MLSALEKWEPAVDKKILILLSGLMWCTVGIVLCAFAWGWVSQLGNQWGIWLVLLGLLLSLLIHFLGFSRLVGKNIARILPKKEKVCVFAFQAWKSYLIIAIMIGLGITLRRSSIPRQYLIVLYTGIGCALIWSSFGYFRAFFSELTAK